MTLASDKSGFTLIEIILTLAVSSLLALIIFAGQANVRSQFQFADGIDRVKNELNAIKTEANTTVNVDPGNPAPGSNDDYITYGKLFRLDNGATTDQIVVSTIKYKTNSALAGPTITIIPENTITIPWSVSFTGTHTQYIAFVRSATDGHLVTVIPPTWPWSPTSFSNYPDSPSYAGSAATVTMTFRDPDNHTGRVVVNSNGAITRLIQ